MVQITKRSKSGTNKPLVSGSKKRSVSNETNIMGDLFNMVEDLFGPDQQRRIKK